MLNVNSILITGRLVDKVTVKTSSNGKSFATYTIANTWYNSKKTAEDGSTSYEAHTDFYDCVESVGNVEAYSKKVASWDKGRELHILGKLVKKVVKKDDGTSTAFYSVRVVKSNLNYACFEGKVVSDGTKYASKREGDNGGFVRFRIASDGLNFKNTQGEWVTKTAFIDCRMNLFNFEKYVVPAKGDDILVEGYFETEEYTTKDGENRSRLTLVVDSDTYSRKAKVVAEEKPAPAQKSNQTQADMLSEFDDIPF